MAIEHMSAAEPIDDDEGTKIVRLSRANPGYRVERLGDGAISLSPTGGFGAAPSGKAFRLLDEYADRAGGVAFDSNGGWRLRDLDDRPIVYAPDASWICARKADAVSDEDRAGAKILAIDPDVVIEIRSPSDAWSKTIAKLEV